MNMSAVRKSIAMIAIGFAITLGAIAPELSARTKFPTIGSGGDGSQTQMCPAGEYVIGFAGASGAWIDRIGIICGKAKAGGGFSGPVTYRPELGGRGGAESEFSCNEGWAIGSLVMELTDERRQVQSIFSSCKGPGSTKEDYVRFGAFLPAWIPTDSPLNVQICPASELMVGVVINYGKHVNGMGMICDKLVVQPATAAPPAPVGAAVPARTGRTVEYGKKKPQTIITFTGVWKITTSTGAHYDLALNPIGFDPMTQKPTGFTGYLVNTDGNANLTGNIQAMPRPGGFQLDFNYQQPGAQSAGSGVLGLIDDGKKIVLNGTDAKLGAFTAEGTRK